MAATLRDVVDATKSLHTLAEMIKNYNPTPEELEDLFYLKPSLRDSYDKIKNWVIPSKLDLTAVVTNTTDVVKVPDTVINEPVVITEAPPIAIPIEPEKQIIPVEEKDTTNRHYIPPKSNRPIDEQMNTLIEFVKKCDGMIFKPDCLDKASEELVKTGLVDYNRSYKFLSRRGYKECSEGIFEIKNNMIHVFKVVEEHTEAPKVDLTVTQDAIKNPSAELANIVLGKQFIDKQEFLKNVDGVPKSLYVSIAAHILSKKDMEEVIKEENPKTMMAYMSIARTKCALVAVNEAKMDDITVCILICAAIQKNGKRYNKCYTAIKNKYNVIVNKNFFDDIVNGKFHPEILEVFCTSSN